MGTQVHRHTHTSEYQPNQPSECANPVHTMSDSPRKTHIQTDLFKSKSPHTPSCTTFQHGHVSLHKKETATKRQQREYVPPITNTNTLGGKEHRVSSRRHVSLRF